MGPREPVNDGPSLIVDPDLLVVEEGDEQYTKLHIRCERVCVLGEGGGEEPVLCQAAHAAAMDGHGKQAHIKGVESAQGGVAMSILGTHVVPAASPTCTPVTPAACRRRQRRANPCC